MSHPKLRQNKFESMSESFIQNVSFTFAMETSDTAADDDDDDEDSDFLSRILGSFLGDSGTAVVASDAGGPPWD